MTSFLKIIEKDSGILVFWEFENKNQKQNKLFWENANTSLSMVPFLEVSLIYPIVRQK